MPYYPRFCSVKSTDEYFVQLPVRIDKKEAALHMMSIDVLRIR